MRKRMMRIISAVLALSLLTGCGVKVQVPEKDKSAVKSNKGYSITEKKLLTGKEKQ